MTDYFSRALRNQDSQPELIEAQTAPAEGRGSAPTTDYFSRALRPDAPASTSRQPTNADLTYDPDKTLGFVQQAKGSFAVSDPQWKSFAGRELYPNDPNAASRLGRTKEGRAFHRGDDGKLYEVQPPKGFARFANAGEGVGPSLPVVAGGTAGIAGLPLGGVGSVGTAAIGGYGGEVVRQMVGNALLGEEGKPSEYSQSKAVTEGVLGGIGQGAGNALNTFVGRYAAPDIASYGQAATNHLLQQAERMGVRLTPAEATGLNSLVGEQKRLAAVPQSANTMTQFAEERNREVTGAWRDFLGGISPARDASVVGRDAAQSAQGILEAAQTARTAAVQPFYDQAERQIATVNPGNVVQFIENALPTAKGSERNALNYVMNQLRRTGEETIDMSFRGLNGAKQAIDTILQNEDLAAKAGIDRTAHRTLEQARNLILQSIDNAPGAGGQAGPYAAGRATYGAMTDAHVTPVQEVLAPLLRANPANSSIVRTAQSVLDPASRSPELVAQARQMIQRQSPQVWDSMVRQFLQEEAVTALQENAKGFVSNAGGNIAKRIGNDSIEANMRAAMTPQQFIRYREIVDVFRATGRAVDTNSDTAFKLAAQERAKREAGGWVATTARNINPAEMARNVASFFAERNYERQAEAIARIYASGDRNAVAQLRSLRQYNPEDTRRLTALGHVLTRAGVDLTAWALD